MGFDGFGFFLFGIRWWFFLCCVFNADFVFILFADPQRNDTQVTASILNETDSGLLAAIVIGCASAIIIILSVVS